MTIIQAAPYPGAFDSFQYKIIMSWGYAVVGGAAMRGLIDTQGAGGVFDPETVDILVGAFDDAWKSVQSSGAPFAAQQYTDIVRNILAKQIIDEARKGERNRRQLSQAALLQLSRSNLKGSAPFPNP
jgi:hypothetical protein